MRALVVGGGVVGVTTAYYLAREGVEVELVESAPEVGTDATAGNAGLIAPGHSFAWASPRAPGMLLRSLFGKQTAIQVRLRLDPELLGWGLRFLRECTSDRAVRNTLVKLRICRYSQQQLDALAQAEGIDYLDGHSGILYLYRDPHELDLGAKKMELLAEHGQEIDVLDAAGVAALEPALAPMQARIAGAVYSPTDGSGSSQVFTQKVAAACERLGATIRAGTPVTSLRADGNRITGAVTDAETLTADVYVLAAGVGSTALARTIGVKLPIYPAKGYSITFPLTGGPAPVVGGVDEAPLVAWSRLGDRLRMTSTAEFAGYDRTAPETSFAGILRVARELFPEAADYERGERRACLRPMTPDGPPVLGTGRYANLYFNTGHGHMGWTMACGSSRAVADLIQGRRPELDLAGTEYRW
ncbi:MAG TPA: D-amino acid dehydrogenase [Gaiellaceae bacterium]|nr:D-amino acid dehydrogenase [Gaiellaceae bacterium]